MSIADYSTSAASNTLLGAIPVGPNMERNKVNDAIQQLMADIASYKSSIVAAKNVKDFGAAGDGVTNDTSAFAAALAAGGDIFVPPGTYLASQFTISAAGQRLIGIGDKSIIRSTDATKDLVVVSAADVEITGLRFEGAATAATNSKFAIFTASGNAAPRLKVINCKFTGADSTKGFTNGIKFDTNADYGVVQNCYFERLWGNASGYGYGVLCGAAYGVLVTGCTGIGASGRGRHFVYLSAGATRCKAIGNYAVGFDYDCIPVYSSDAQPACDQNIIAFNTLSGSVAAAVVTSGAIQLFQNVTNTLVMGNIIYGSGGNGIMVDATSSTKCKNNRIIGNTVVNSGFIGIDVKAMQGGEVCNNDIRESSQSAAGTYSNLRLISDGTTKTSDLLISGNRSTGTTAARSAFQINSTAPTPTGLKVYGNKFETCNLTDIELSGVTCAIDGRLRYVETRDFASVAAGGTLRVTGITVAGAVVGDVVAVSHTQDLSGMIMSAEVTGANTVAVTLFNPTAGAIDVLSGTLRIDVWKAAD